MGCWGRGGGVGITKQWRMGGIRFKASYHWFGEFEATINKTTYFKIMENTRLFAAKLSASNFIFRMIFFFCFFFMSLHKLLFQLHKLFGKIKIHWTTSILEFIAIKSVVFFLSLYKQLTSTGHRIAELDCNSDIWFQPAMRRFLIAIKTNEWIQLIVSIRIFNPSKK